MALYVRMLLLMVVSLYTSRVVLAALGVDDYGIYNLIGGFISLFSFISHALVGAMQRFFNVALGREDHEEYRRIYSMSYNLFALFSVFLLVVGETVGLWFVSTQLNIPEGRETATMWVYQISLLTLIIHLLRTPDNASIIAHEKMGFYALLKLGIVYMLSVVATDKLILYVILYMIATLLINIVYSLFCNLKISNCRYQLMWDGRLFKQLASFSGWHMLTGGSRVIKAQGESFMLNHYYSVAVNAAFGMAAQVYNAVNLFLTNFQTAFKPQLVQTFAAGDIDAHRNLIVRSARLSFFLLLLIVVPVATNLEGLLGLWLKEVPLYTKEFCVLLLLAYLVDSVGAPLAVSVNASGNIRGIQLGSAVLLWSGLLLSFLFLRKGAAPYIVSLITFLVHFGFWTCYMYYARKYSGISIRRYFKSVIVPCFIIALLAIVFSYILSLLLHVSGWIVITLCFFDVLFLAILIYLIGLNHEERDFVRLLINRVVRNKLIRSKE